MATRRQPGQHAATAAPSEGFQATLERAFDWVNRNARAVLWALGLFIVIGGAAAAVFEYTRMRSARAASALSVVEAIYAREMGASPTTPLIPEPANPEHAARARADAIAGLEEVSRGYPGTLAAYMAEIRAAELEVDLVRLQDARDRLQALIASLEPGAAEKGIALRLLGYVLEENGETLQAAEAYAQAGAIQAYRARAAAWGLAGDTFARAGQLERALEAYGQAIAIDTDFATRAGLPQRLEELQALAGTAPPPAAPAP